MLEISQTADSRTAVIVIVSHTLPPRWVDSADDKRLKREALKLHCVVIHNKITQRLEEVKNRIVLSAVVSHILPSESIPPMTSAWRERKASKAHCVVMSDGHRIIIQRLEEVENRIVLSAVVSHIFLPIRVDSADDSAWRERRQSRNVWSYIDIGSLSSVLIRKEN